MPKNKRSDTTKFICYRYPAGLGKIIDIIMVRRLDKRQFKKKLISRQSTSTYVRDENVNANCVMPAINVHVN